MVIKRTADLSALDNICNRKKEITQNNRAILNRILDNFIQAHTRFESLKLLFLEAGFIVETSEDFANVPQDQIDAFVNKHTNFKSLTALQNEALKEYL
ncbi:MULTISPECIES: hypothetical protein [Acinetobacter]|uniref:hypothetical protein n=1 Tax=Acinetobacter TaxID=469 RepID=UPI000BF55055|nr:MULTISPECIES: hypothetical protein [Acinetobacter]AZC06362.1 hypothetical protein DKE44_012445 [Acinetobacter nosocomialis]MBR7729192.1 hypothetical protein [Acinetobacter nosocomialis]MBR7738985.1 hypothetical protein [Acinetobacter nosocomialis]MBS0033174.1 hypothetical protein [Acinetobacter nosocomialis]MCU4522043.1 hypothetical protein [Acinetobacter ursingii]